MTSPMLSGSTGFLNHSFPRAFSNYIKHLILPSALLLWLPIHAHSQDGGATSRTIVIAPMIAVSLPEEATAATTSALKRADALTSTELSQTSPTLSAPVAPRPIDFKTLSIKLRLDREFFSPTLVDDERWDRRYRNAVKAWQIAHGLKVDGVAGAETSGSLPMLDPLTTTVVVRASDFKALRSYSSDYVEMAELDTLACRSIRELLAERFHTSESFLGRLNPNVNWQNVAAGARICVPYIRRGKPSFYGDHVEVNIAEKFVRVFDARSRIIAHFNCSIGTDSEVYEGLELKIINTVEWPNYTLDPKLFNLTHRVKTKLLLHHGLNNPVGRAWSGMNRSGFGIHGTPEPSDIGRTRSHGCIRLPNWDALSFGNMMRVGTPVYFMTDDRPLPIRQDRATTAPLEKATTPTEMDYGVPIPATWFLSQPE